MTDHERGLDAAVKAFWDARPHDDEYPRKELEVAISAYLATTEPGKPESGVLAEAVKVNVENERLRHIVSDCAAALVSGAFISPKASVEFMEGLPKEISLVVSDLRKRCAELEAALKSDPAPIPAPKPFTFADPAAQREHERHRAESKGREGE